LPVFASKHSTRSLPGTRIFTSNGSTGFFAPLASARSKAYTLPALTAGPE